MDVNVLDQDVKSWISLCDMESPLRMVCPTHKTQSCRTVVNRIVNSDYWYFMVVTFKVVHVVRLDNQKVVTMTTPDCPS